MARQVSQRGAGTSDAPPAVVQPARPGRSTPARRRRSAQETEAALLAAAETVFGERGYFDATVDEMVALAGVSRGTFYLYFGDKQDIFRKLMANVVDDVLASARGAREGTHRQRIESANRSYLAAMQRNCKVLRSLLQVAGFNPEFAAMHAELRSKFVLKIERDLHRKMLAGWVRPMNTHATAYALGLMVEAVAYAWLVTNYQPWAESFEFEPMVQELTNLWCAAVFLPGAENETPEQPPAPAATAKPRRIARPPVSKAG